MPEPGPFPADFSDYRNQIRKITETTARLRRVSLLLRIGKSELPLRLSRIRNPQPSRSLLLRLA